MTCACGKLPAMEQAMRRLPLALCLTPSSSCGQPASLRLFPRKASGSAIARSVHSFLQLSRRSQPSPSGQEERTLLKRHNSSLATWFNLEIEGVPSYLRPLSGLSPRAKSFRRRGCAPVPPPLALTRDPFLTGRRSLAGPASKPGSGPEHQDLLAHLKLRPRAAAEVAMRKPIGEGPSAAGPLEAEEDDDLVAVEMPPGSVLEEGMEVTQSGTTSFVLPRNISHDRARVKSAVFVKSSPDVSQCPPGTLPEFALVGRSNVGKSSLVNMLVNRKELAQTSKKPGKTQLINHYLINNSWYLVDLPGYGYANAPTTVRTDWNNFTKDYFLKRDTLVAVCLLVDATIPPQHIDLECANWLGRNKIPLTVVFTKCDKRKKKKQGGRRPEENIKDFEAQLREYYAELPPWIMTSSNNGTGKMELLVHLAQLRTFWKS